MKLLVAVVLFVAACTAGEDTSTPDAAVETVDADAAVCAPRSCGTAPMPYHVDVTYNGDGTVTMSTDDYGKVQAFLDRTLLWSSCETH